MRVAYHPEAVIELAEAAQFYDSRVPRLGTEFLDEVDRTVSEITKAPERYVVVRNQIRRCMLRRFPYGVYYRETGSSIRILVIRHHSRDPDHGLGRS